LSYSPGRAGQQARQENVEWWTKLFRDRNVDAISRWLYPSNETPVHAIQSVTAFSLCRWPTVNGWYRLFDPGHGLVDSWYRDTYGQISPEDETPAIFVSWYDAWSFCLWARWAGQSCELPHENQWEYAAKAGTDWSWNYWCGDEFDASKCNADQNVGRTTRPDPAHANPWGLEDILGNVWEWTDDEYRRAYDLDAPPDSSARVLRGGSWNDDAYFVRSAFRYGLVPWLSENLTVFSCPGLYGENLDSFFPPSSFAIAGIPTLAAGERAKNFSTLVFSTESERGGCADPYRAASPAGDGFLGIPNSASFFATSAPWVAGLTALSMCSSRPSKPM
jgi:hypothetical protein